MGAFSSSVLEECQVRGIGICTAFADKRVRSVPLLQFELAVIDFAVLRCCAVSLQRIRFYDRTLLEMSGDRTACEVLLHNGDIIDVRLNDPRSPVPEPAKRYLFIALCRTVHGHMTYNTMALCLVVS